MLPTATDSSVLSSNEASIAESKTHIVQNLEKPKFSLYLRFPKKLNKDRTKAIEEVKQLNNSIINVRVPRQKSANFCLVDFQSHEELVTAAVALKLVKSMGRRLVVKEATKSKPKNVEQKKETIRELRDTKQVLNKLIAKIKLTLATHPERTVTNGICIKGLPKNIQESDIKKCFTDLLDCHIALPKDDKKNAVAFVTLPTPRDALKATRQKCLLNGQLYKVEFQKDAQTVKIEAKKSVRYFNSPLLRKVGASNGDQSRDDNEKLQNYN